MQEFKIIFAGSMGAGKTTAIKALSDKEVISTDVANSDKKAHNKLLTTVGIDYGQILLPPDTKVGLYGTPGQERFELVWRVVTEGALGAIVLVDGSSPKAAKELPYNYLTLAESFKILEARDFKFPIFEVDARKRDDVLLLVETLIASIEAELN